MLGFSVLQRIFSEPASRAVYLLMHAIETVVPVFDNIELIPFFHLSLQGILKGEVSLYC
jgi:hypothetical protein